MYVENLRLKMGINYLNKMKPEMTRSKKTQGVYLSVEFKGHLKKNYGVDGGSGGY